MSGPISFARRFTRLAVAGWISALPILKLLGCVVLFPIAVLMELWPIAIVFVAIIIVGLRGPHQFEISQERYRELRESYPKLPKHIQVKVNEASADGEITVAELQDIKNMQSEFEEKQEELERDEILGVLKGK